LTVKREDRCRQCGARIARARQARYCSRKCVSRAHYTRNREAISARHRLYYKAHKEEALARSSKWYKANRARRAEISRRWELSQYGLSLEQYRKMVKASGGKCELCRAVPQRKALAVDHDHTTNKVRGVLCGPCNQALGLFRDDTVLLTKAIAYLERRPRA